MSSGQTSKKAVHVKWAGKTIALGTFPTAEADDKCARAKALTRAWRSTMRPKPSREWVMNELEKLNVRVVSGRVAQKDNSASDSEGGDAVPSHIGSSTNPQQRSAGALSSINHNTELLNRRNSITASLLGVANDRRNSLASLDPSLFLTSRQGSLPLSANVPRSGEKRSGTPDPHIPPHRPLVGGGAAAAYEALREDYYEKLAQQRKSQSKEGGNNNGKKVSAGGSVVGGAVGNISNDTGGLGTLNQMGGTIGGMNPMSLPSNANQHYEMLKLHHMNLLNEIQETTLMMNLYQQQQIQQQLQQDQLNNSQLSSVLTQQQQLLSSGGNLNHQSNGNVGLGPLINQPNALSQVGGMVGGEGGPSQRSSSVNNSKSLELQSNVEKRCSDAAKEGPSRAEQLQKIKDEIAERQRMVDQLERIEPKQKRSKTEITKKEA